MNEKKQLNKKNSNYKLTGLDFSSQMLENTVLNSKELKSIDLIKGSAFETPFPENTFDFLS